MKNTCIQSLSISLAFKFFLATICGYGLLLHISPTDAQYNVHMFSYFTVISNTLCFVVTVIYVIKALVTKYRLKKEFSISSIYSEYYIFFKGMALMGIILTFAIYHFMVAKYKYPLLHNNILYLPTKDMLAHYLVPLLFVLDWLLFQPKNLNNLHAPLYWMLYPITYLVTIMIRAFCFPKSSLLYLREFPYFFLDIINLGPDIFIIFMVLIILIILIIGYAIIGIERLFCLIAIRR